MSTTDTFEDRRSALDEFAASASRQEVATVPIMGSAPPPTLIHGAQAVAVQRDEVRVLQRIRTLAAAAGSEWVYRIPFKDRKTGTTTYAEGGTIKLANDVARCYGSCDVDSWVSGEGPDFWEITARFIDLESGFSLSRPFRQRKSASKMGGSDDSRRLEASFQIGVSKAERNVVLNALQTFADEAFEAAKNALVDKIGKDVDHWRQRVVERLSAYVALDRVEKVVGRKAQEWMAPDIAKVYAMMKTIADGMASVDETFPATTVSNVESAKLDLDRFANASYPDTSASVQGSPSPVDNGGGGVQQTAAAIPEHTEESPTGLHPSGVDTGEPPLGPPSRPSSVSPDAAAADRQELVDAAMHLASRTDLDPSEKLGLMGELRAEATDNRPNLTAQFINTVVETGAKVIRKELTKAAAQKYLDVLKEKDG